MSRRRRVEVQAAGPGDEVLRRGPDGTPDFWVDGDGRTCGGPNGPIAPSSSPTAAQWDAMTPLERSLVVQQAAKVRR